MSLLPCLHCEGDRLPPPRHKPAEFVAGPAGSPLAEPGPGLALVPALAAEPAGFAGQASPGIEKKLFKKKEKNPIVKNCLYLP